jgi:hypothetical protein
MKDTSVPIPVLERGDQVRLAKPYKPMVSKFRGPLKETIKAHLAKRCPEDTPSIEQAYHNSEHDDLFKFPSGIVAEVLERYPWNNLNETGREVFGGVDDPPNGPVANVSLNLYNPTLGTVYVGGHPTQPGKVEFVDCHATELNLFQKHDRNWGESPEVDIYQLYSEWGLPTPLGGEEDGS